MRQNGLNITVGTDSLSSNDDLDMVKEIFCVHDNFKQVPMGEILTWACLNGARFLSKDTELGSIVPGKHPGLVLVNNVDADGCFTAESRSKRII
jgi:cytosine/adenosine deaminase-related metal-dependent hydrolase